MTRPSAETRLMLDELERRLDPETEEDFIRQWKDFHDGRFAGEIFRPVRKKLRPIDFPLPSIHINDAVEDLDLMLRSQLCSAFSALSRPWECLGIRANYGTGILSSLFGAELFMMPRETATLPTTRAIGDTEKIRSILERGTPDLREGLGRRVFDFAEFTAEAFRPYPKIRRFLPVYHPDTQGPLDICELLWGGEMFYAMYDEPELVHGMLDLVSGTYTAFLDRWFGVFPAGEELNTHWGTLMFRGGILLRDDSAMNLSPALYEAFAAPYDGRLLSRFGGGVVHFCGRGDHYIPILSKLPGLTGINLSQPEYNDMEIIYRNTVDRGIKILAFREDRAKKDAGRPGGFHHNLSAIPG